MISARVSTRRMNQQRGGKKQCVSVQVRWSHARRSHCCLSYVPSFPLPHSLAASLEPYNMFSIFPNEKSPMLFIFYFRFVQVLSERKKGEFDNWPPCARTQKSPSANRETTKCIPHRRRRRRRRYSDWCYCCAACSIQVNRCMINNNAVAAPTTFVMLGCTRMYIRVERIRSSM